MKETTGKNVNLKNVQCIFGLMSLDSWQLKLPKAAFESAALLLIWDVCHHNRDDDNFGNFQTMMRVQKSFKTFKNANPAIP